MSRDIYAEGWVSAWVPGDRVPGARVNTYSTMPIELIEDHSPYCQCQRADLEWADEWWAERDDAMHWWPKRGGGVSGWAWEAA